MNLLFKLTKILKDHPVPRHNTATDRELPEDLPQGLRAAERVLTRPSGHVPPLYHDLYTVLQCSLCHFWLQMGDKEDNISTFSPFKHDILLYVTVSLEYQCYRSITTFLGSGSMDPLYGFTDLDPGDKIIMDPTGSQ
jgi:hypothetical protein